MHSDLFKLDESFKAVFQFCIHYDKQSIPLAVGTGRARACCNHLNIIKEQIFKLVASDKFSKLDSSISWGSGRFPRVPWVGFHLLGTKVSNSLSVVICFSRDGRGVVAGLMSAVALKSNIKTVVRDHGDNFLNIDGSSKTAYNNKFINPKEFYSENLKIKDLILHTSKSLDLLYRNLSLG